MNSFHKLVTEYEDLVSCVQFNLSYKKLETIHTHSILSRDGKQLTVGVIFNNNS